MNMRYLCAIVAVVALLSACGQAPTAPPSTPPANTSALDPAQALLGSWTTTVTKEDLLRVVPDFKTEFLCDSAGTGVWQFNADGTFRLDQTAPLAGCPKPEQTHNEGIWSTQGNLITLGKGSSEEMVYEWTVKDDILTFTYRSGSCIPCRAGDTATPWKRVK